MLNLQSNDTVKIVILYIIVVHDFIQESVSAYTTNCKIDKIVKILHFVTLEIRPRILL